MRKHWWALTAGRLSLCSAALAVLISSSGGCRTPPVQGRSSIEWMDPIIPNPPNSGVKGTASATDIIINDIPPTFTGILAKPAYPAAALSARVGDYVVYATIIIDTNGQVSAVNPSWRRPNFPNRYSDKFLEAVRMAVSTWRFVPARNVYWEKDGSGELKYLSTEAIPAQTDIKFTFEASGSVR
jgi:hypothetical protein